MADLKIINDIKAKYPFVKIYASENDSVIHLHSIVVPEEHRRKGIGRDILSWIKDYAHDVQKAIVLEPSAERGYKQKLDKFYRNLGFMHNRGKNKDYTLTSPFASTMYWKPRLKFKEWLNDIAS